MLFTWTTKSSDYPLGKGTYNSAAELSNLIINLIEDEKFFVQKKDEETPKDNPTKDFELTETAKIAYSIILNQFYIIFLEGPASKQVKSSLNSVYKNLNIISPFFKVVKKSE